MESYFSRAVLIARKTMQSQADSAVKGTRKASMSSNGSNGKQEKSYHKQATGLALQTAKEHEAEHGLKLYGSCFW